MITKWPISYAIKILEVSDKPKKSSQEKNYFRQKVFELEQLDTSTNDAIKLGPPFATLSCFQMSLNPFPLFGQF